MAFFFGDGYDLYAAPADAIAGYWDSGTTGFTLVAGRFPGSRAIQNSATGAWLVKSSGSNDAVHHIVCAFQQTATLTGTTLGAYFQLSDSATNQCCIVFRSDGAILLTSATPAGTVLATYTGAVTAASTWYAFEFEVVINSTTGSFAVRKNGNTSNDFSAGSLNTRPGTNNYANKLTIGQQAAVNNQILDDTLWRSDTASVSFSGDIRCFTRMPVSDASVQWSRSGSVVPVTPFATSGTTAIAAGNARYIPFTAPCAGTLGTASVSLGAGYTGNMKCSLFASSSGVPTTSIASAGNVVNPATGANVFTFASPPALTQGTQYFLGFDSDTTSGTWAATAISNVCLGSTTPYASFPAANPTTSAASAPVATMNITPTAATNAPFVADLQQDAAASYVFDSTVGHSDLYGVAAIGSTPSTTVGVVTRCYAQKSDAGTRNIAVQLQSGGSNVQSASTALNTTFGWISRTDLVDPATSAAWTAAGVANAQIGAVVTA